MVAGVMPFSCIGDMYQYKFSQRPFPRNQLNLSNLSETGINFMESLIQVDPQLRMTAGFALESDWVTSASPGFQITEQMALYLKNWQKLPKAPEAPRSNATEAAKTIRIPSPISNPSDALCIPSTPKRRQSGTKVSLEQTVRKMSTSGIASTDSRGAQKLKQFLNHSDKPVITAKPAAIAMARLCGLGSLVDVIPRKPKL
jgi:serine/threonine protein kinase